MKYNPKKIEDLLSNKLIAKSSTTDWISTLSYTYPQVAFTTKVSFSQRTVEVLQISFVNELDFLLNSPERVLLMLLQSTATEINIAVARFLELNGYDLDYTEGRSIFNEVYNNIYAIRTVMRYFNLSITFAIIHLTRMFSNIPGFRVVLAGGKTTLPIADDSTSLADLFKGVFGKDNNKNNITKTSKLQLVGKVNQSGITEMEEEDDEEPASAPPTGGKNKKRRRAK